MESWIVSLFGSMRRLIPNLCLGIVLIVNGCGKETVKSRQHPPSSSQRPAGQAILTWETPTTDLAARCTKIVRYRIHYGQRPRQYTRMDEIWLNSEKVACINTNLDKTCGSHKRTCSYSIENLGPGTWFFAIQSISELGEESLYSNEVIKEIDIPKINDF